MLIQPPTDDVIAQLLRAPVDISLLNKNTQLGVERFLQDLGLSFQIRDQHIVLDCYPSLLSANMLHDVISTEDSAVINSLVIKDVCSSSNKLLHEADFSPLEGIDIVVCEGQTAGMGTKQRLWHSPIGENLYLSFSAYLPSTANVSFLPLAFSIVLAQSLRARYQLPGLGVKWPNDIYHEGRKLAGLLMQVRSRGKHTRVVVGLGLNVNMQKELGQIQQQWVSLAQVTGGRLNREPLLAQVIHDFITTLRLIEDDQIDDLLNTWPSVCVHYRQQVMLIHQDTGAHESVLSSDIDRYGRLCVEKAHGRDYLSANEISLRTSLGTET